METACLITGKSGTLLAGIVRNCVDRNRRVLVARSGQTDLPGLPPDAPPPVTWNRRSPLSARSLLLHARTVCDMLTEAIVAYSPVRETVPFHSCSVVSIEDRVDAEVKGYQFLLRELIALFQNQRAGRLVLAVMDSSGPVPSPLEAATLGSFMALGRALQSTYHTSDCPVQLLYSSSEDTQGFARFVVDTLDTSVPRRVAPVWRTFPSRSRLFSLFSRDH